jgi:CTP:molybdopterin cytidylyltransferase MocA
MTNVAGIVLAAGRSARMGQSKAQLEAAPGVTFLEHAVKALRQGGCRYVIAVVNDDEDWTARLADVSGAAVVINELNGSQQIDSIRLGLAQVPDDSEAVLVLPVDVPGLQTDTVRTVIDAFARTRAPVVVPVHGGIPGHPVLFARRTFGELLVEPLPQGAESIVAAHSADRLEVSVADPAILTDVDSPADYRRFKGE